jgi:hypothetical protein
MEFLPVFLLAVGLYVLYISLKWMNTECRPTVINRYVPRTLEEEMKSPVKPSEIFKGMFDETVPYDPRGNF